MLDTWSTYLGSFQDKFGQEIEGEGESTFALSSLVL